MTLLEPRPLGPHSMLWHYAGDSRIAFLGPSIGLLQLLHPAIGAGVLEHSDFFDDPYDRVFRSLPRIIGVVYDGPAAVDTGRTVRDFHKPIKGVDDQGRRYHALDPETFWWAHATFQYMAEEVAERFDTHRLSRADREELYLDGVEWFRRYGVSARAVPATYGEYREKFDYVCREVLEMNPAAEWVVKTLKDPRVPALRGQLGWARTVLAAKPVRQLGGLPIRLAAIGGLPRIVRERFDLPWSRADQIRLDALELAVRQGWRFVPFPLRWHPRAQDGWRRYWSERAA